MDQEFEQLAAQLIEVGSKLAAKGLVPATSGNFSARLANGDMAITTSGVDKGSLLPENIMRTNAAGESYDQRVPSAETLLHVQLYRQFPDAKVVLHAHSLNATVISQVTQGNVELANYELLKAFRGIDTHATQIEIPVFNNDQNISRLAQQVDDYMQVHECPVAYLIAGHGYYTWGRSAKETLIYIEALEFLFSCELLKRRIM
ncbi:methylthioribulose 1-phosphate dehydratase [Kaarinaea lacus]